MIRTDYMDSQQKVPQDTDTAFTNPHSKGVTCRTSWGRIEQTEGNFYWDFLDGCVNNAVAAGKKFSLMIACGTNSPTWLYDDGAAKFNVTVDAGGSIKTMPLPWDAVFQTKYSAMQHAVAARYSTSPNLGYVDLPIGRSVEADFVSTDADVVAFNAVGGLPKWTEGIKWMIDTMTSCFPNTPVTLITGPPVPGTDGQDALQAVIDYGVAKHPGNHFAISSHGLWYPNGPGANSIGAIMAMKLTSTSTPGFQFWGPIARYPYSVDPATGRTMMDETLELCYTWGGKFVEVRAGDCDDPVSWPAMDKWNPLLISGGAPSPTPGQTSIRHRTKHKRTKSRP